MNRQTLKREYLETTSRAGVYMIRNQVTGHAMVASSTNVQGTLNRHLFELRHGTHRNGQMTQDWNTHGEQSFVFDVLDKVKPREDAAFDSNQELQTLIELWQQEILGKTTSHYTAPEKAA